MLDNGAQPLQGAQVLLVRKCIERRYPIVLPGHHQVLMHFVYGKIPEVSASNRKMITIEGAACHEFGVEYLTTQTRRYILQET